MGLETALNKFLEGPGCRLFPADDAGRISSLYFGVKNRFSQLSWWAVSVNRAVNEEQEHSRLMLSLSQRGGSKTGKCTDQTGVG